MNGRIYDGRLGRFLQADPQIQEPNNSQSLNRYSYVINNPLSYTDPTGFSFWTKIRDNLLKPILSIVVGTYLPFIGQMAWGWSATASYAAVGFVVGGISTGSLKGAVMGAFSSGVMAYVGGPPSSVNTAPIAADIIDPSLGKAVNFLYNGFESDKIANTTINLAHEVQNYYVSKEIARFARKNGMTLMEFNTLLTLNSFAGNHSAGSRYNLEENEVLGFGSRRENLLGIIWDINDTILGYQGLLDASAHDYIIGRKAGQALGICHSLGALTCNNLVARGYAPSAILNSLPFGNIADAANTRTTNLGRWDLVNGGWLGRIFNPLSNSSVCGNGGLSGSFCHGVEDNYRGKN